MRLNLRSSRRAQSNRKNPRYMAEEMRANAPGGMRKKIVTVSASTWTPSWLPMALLGSTRKVAVGAVIGALITIRQSNSPITSPYGKIGIGRPVWSGNVVSGLIPR